MVLFTMAKRRDSDAFYLSREGPHLLCGRTSRLRKRPKRGLIACRMPFGMFTFHHHTSCGCDLISHSKWTEETTHRASLELTAMTDVGTWPRRSVSNLRGHVIHRHGLIPRCRLLFTNLPKFVNDLRLPSPWFPLTGYMFTTALSSFKRSGKLKGNLKSAQSLTPVTWQPRD